MPEMRIGIDCRFAGTNSGLGRYTRELTAALQKRNDGIEYVLFGNDNAPFPHYSLREQTSFPGIIKKSGVDLFFAPHFNVPLLCPVPFVATIHDLILHRYPNQASSTKRLAYRAVMRHTVRKAQSLIAVSQFTADELTSVYGKDVKKKISVIHEAVSDEFIKKSAAACSPTLNRFGLKKPFFLYVGNAKQHKNVQMLIDAYRSLNSTETELVLVTGGREAESLKLCDGVRVLPDVPESDLPCLYFFAACFVTASLYEGFGLPVLEAHACGCPVIVTDHGSFPEIAPDGARIVKPTVSDIAEALAEPPSAAERGTMRTWKEVAEDTAKILLAGVHS